LKTAVVFLCKDINPELANFCHEIGTKTDFGVFVIEDNEEGEAGKILPQDENTILFRVNSDKCKENGYYGTNIKGATHIDKEVVAMDKFLYLFSHKSNWTYGEYDNVWVFEDDVFIPSVETIINLNEKYKTQDLVTPRNEPKLDNVPDWHWRFIFDKIFPPYFSSMACAIMVSKKMLKEISIYVSIEESLFYVEAFFNTLAMQATLPVTDAKELKSIVWQGEWNIEHFNNLPNNCFHPKKDIENYGYYRAELKRLKKTNTKLKVELPNFLL